MVSVRLVSRCKVQYKAVFPAKTADLPPGSPTAGGGHDHLLPQFLSRSSAKISPASCVSLFKCHRVCECILVEKPCLRLSECSVLFNRKYAMTLISRRGTRRSGYLMCALKEKSSSSDLQDWSQPEPPDLPCFCTLQSRCRTV